MMFDGLSLTEVCWFSRTIPEKSVVQKLALAYWVFHYVKRILETFFVHV